jgi:mycoredoxin
MVPAAERPSARPWIRAAAWPLAGSRSTPGGNVPVEGFVAEVGERLPDAEDWCPTMQTHPDEIVVYSTTWCSDCRRAKRVLDRMGARYRWIDVDEDEAAAERVVRINRGLRVVPTILFPDGTIMTEPSDAELAAKLAG